MKKTLILSAIFAFLTLGLSLLVPSPVFAQRGPRPAPTAAAAAAATSNAKVCEFVSSDPGNAQRQACESCFAGSGSWTAIGCIPTTPQAFIAKFLGFGIGIAGGIAFLLILFGGLQILTSAGNPEKMNAGRELVSAAISGLLLIIFSVFLLRLIGYNILGLPGFG